MVSYSPKSTWFREFALRKDFEFQSFFKMQSSFDIHLFYPKNRGSNGQSLWHFSHKGQVEEFWVVVIKIQQVDKHCGAR